MAANVTSVDRDPVTGTVLGTDNQKRLLVKVPEADAPIGLPLDGVEEIAFADRQPSLPAHEQAPLKVVLLDGSTFIGTPAATANPDTFRLRTTSAGTVEINIESLSRVEMRAHPKAAQDFAPSADELKDRVEEFKTHFVTGGPGICDVIEVTDKGFRLYFPGITKDASSAPLTTFDKVRSITRRATKSTEPTELFGIFSTDTGDVVKGIPQGWDADRLTLRTPHCGTVELKSKVLIAATFKNGRFVYLSDLDPRRVEEVPFIRSPDFKPEDHLFSWRRDSAQGGGPLAIRGRHYTKGLGVHAISSLTFRSDKRYTRFTATIGVDDSASELGSVVFKVLVDGQPRDFAIVTPGTAKSDLKKQPDSGILRPTDNAVRIEVEITSASEVTLIVEAANDSDVGDRANWANAKFIR